MKICWETTEFLFRSSFMLLTYLERNPEKLSLLPNIQACWGLHWQLASLFFLFCFCVLSGGSHERWASFSHLVNPLKIRLLISELSTSIFSVFLPGFHISDPHELSWRQIVLWGAAPLGTPAGRQSLEGLSCHLALPYIFIRSPLSIEWFHSFLMVSWRWSFYAQPLGATPDPSYSI